jgi:ribosome-associated protein
MLIVTPEIRIPLSEFECTYVRSSGPGGQNVNKVNSKCVLRWDVRSTPSLREPVRARFMATYATRLTKEGELLLTSDSYRDQKRNFNDCLEKLAAMLKAVARPPKIRAKTKPTRGSERRREAGKKAHSEKKAQRRGNWE